MKTKPKAVADRVELTDDWKVNAMSAVLEFANDHVGEKHLGEDIRAFAEGEGVAIPSDARAWGPVLKQAEKNGVIKNVGYAPTKSSNGSPKVLWEMIGA